LRDGRLFGDGNKEQVLRADALSELFGVPVQVYERNGFYHAW
jgi:iron complex transport system ATP-binding protein